MRNEIEEKIKNSGTASEAQLIENYKNALKNLGMSEKEVERLAQNKETIQTLKHQIDLDHLNINDDEIEEIAQMIVDKKPYTKQLSLCGNHLTDEGASKLARILMHSESLSSLDLQGNKIGKEGFRAIYEMAVRKPELDLALRGNKLRDAGEVEKIKQGAKRKYEEEKKLTPKPRP